MGKFPGSSCAGTGRVPLRMCLAVAGLMAVMCSVCTAQTVYRWSDARGQVHFSSQPPGQDQSVTELAMPDSPPPVRSGRGAQRWQQQQQRALDAYQRERQFDREQQAKADRRSKRRQAACANLRSRLKTLSNGRPIFYQLPDGGRRYLSDTERAAKKKKIQTQMVQLCNGTDAGQ